MLAEKRTLSFEEIEAQTALELPERETPVVVIIGCVALCVGKIRIDVEDVNVAAQVCAAVLNINAILGQTVVECDIRQR